jgi:hypothetical protein
MPIWFRGWILQSVVAVAHVYTVAFQGIEAREVDVQVHISDSGVLPAALEIAAASGHNLLTFWSICPNCNFRV